MVPAWTPILLLEKNIRNTQEIILCFFQRSRDINKNQNLILFSEIKFDELKVHWSL